jgi:hypothetical protein
MSIQVKLSELVEVEEKASLRSPLIQENHFVLTDQKALVEPQPLMFEKKYAHQKQDRTFLFVF